MECNRQLLSILDTAIGRVTLWDMVDKAKLTKSQLGTLEHQLALVHTAFYADGHSLSSLLWVPALICAGGHSLLNFPPHYSLHPSFDADAADVPS